MNKKIIMTISGLVIAGVIVGGVIVATRGSKTMNAGSGVYVESVSMITGNYGSLGMQNRFSGVVEPQQTIEIKLDSSKTVKECYVEVGQSVEAGTPLFLYDTGEMTLNLEQGKLELERINNEIASSTRQIATLESEKANASNDDKLSYTIEIQNLQNTIKRSEYNKNAKQLELEQLQKSIDTAKVVSSTEGVIKAINNGGNNQQEPAPGGGSDAYITILATGEYRVKATTNEQNIGMLNQGQKIISRSRVDENITWTGTISSIDKENPVSNQNNGMMYGGNDTNSMPTSKYNFYVTLDSFDGLMLGQHVFIEIDEGQGVSKEGLWIPGYYLEKGEEESYIWVANSKDKIEKRKIVLGEYDENMDQYQVIEGLTPEEFIAFPDEGLQEGTKVIKAGEEIME